MNAGVCTEPCAVLIKPRRAWVSGSCCIRLKPNMRKETILACQRFWVCRVVLVVFPLPCNRRQHISTPVARRAPVSWLPLVGPLLPGVCRRFSVSTITQFVYLPCPHHN